MKSRRPSKTLVIGVAALLAGTATMVAAQVEREGGGLAPIDSSSSFEVSGVRVDIAGPNAEAARLAGWRLAQRRGWDMLSQRLTGRAGSLSDSTLDSIVTGIVVENEQIGPQRYVARLGVLFSRARAGSILGVATQATRSPAMLVVPLFTSGGASTVFERPTPWQEAWSRFRTGNTTVDYVRLAGTGPDSLLVNAGQVTRRGRGWWRTILNQYGALDVLVPQVRLQRQWPGGPVIGEFIAGHGPDHRMLGRFLLRVEREDGIPALMDEGVRRIDAIYQSALRSGMLRADDALVAPPPGAPPPELVEDEAPTGESVEEGVVSTAATRITLSIQYDTPGVGAVSAAEGSLRSVPGVQSALTSSLALGGVSIMRVTFDGDPTVLRAALEARGWQVSGSGDTLRIRRGAAPGSATPAPAASPAPAPTDASTTGE